MTLAMNETKVMNTVKREVSTVGELLAAVAHASVEEIVVIADLTDAPTFRLSPGQALVGAKGVALRFAPAWTAHSSRPITASKLSS